MNNKICKIHSKPAQFCEKDASQNFQKRLKLQNTEDIANEQQQALQQLELKFDLTIKQLREFAEILEEYTQQIQQKISKFKQQMEQNLTFLIDKQNKLNNKINNFTNLQLNQVIEEENIINNSFEQMKQQIIYHLKELEINTKLEQLYQSINSFTIETNNQVNKQIKIQEKKEFNQKFGYQLMYQSSYPQNGQCNAIAFNQDATLMVAGCDELIEVFEFQDNKLKKVQQLDGHLEGVTCLQFMKKSNKFISAAHDKIIITWECNENNQWHINQVTKDHKSSILCITMNPNEDLLISGSRDETIKFWQKQNAIWCLIQSIYCQSYVFSISLSNQEDTLIATVYGQQILIIQQQSKSWIIKQKISVEQYGHRLCYINQDQFVFQPKNGKYLQIFDYDANDLTIKNAQELCYSNKQSDDIVLFPIRFISQIGLIMVKHGKCVHLIIKSQNGEFQIKQSINFHTDDLYGCITDDGKYIATWDSKSREIKIRKLVH